MSILMVPVITSDFEADNAIISAMSRLNYLLIKNPMSVGRNGMDYIDSYNETWQLSVSQYEKFRANIPMTYCLRYEGNDPMTIKRFNALCTLEAFKGELKENPDAKPWYNFWKKFRGE